MAKSPRKKLIVWTCVLVILVGVVVVADRIAAGIAEDKVGGLIASQASEHGVNSSRAPDVDITGFPFLTQVIGGEYSEIDINLTDVGAEDLTIPKLEIRATKVTAALSDVMSGNGPITASHLEADGYISYDSLTKAIENLIDAEVSPKDGNTLAISATVDFAGKPIDVVGTATVDFSGEVLSIQAQDFSADGVTLPPGGEEILSGLASQFSREIPMPVLPYGLVLDTPRFEKDSIVVSATAENVPLV